MSVSSIAIPRIHQKSARATTTGRSIAFACLAMLVSYLPFSSVNAFLGTIGQSTGASTSDLQWVTDAFTVALAGTVLSGGVLAARYGRARVTLLGLALSAIGCAVGLLSGLGTRPEAIHALWAAQALAGIGGGLVMSASLELIVSVTESTAARAQAIGLWAGANVIALGGGPFISGVIVERTDWRWLYVPVLACLLAVCAFGVISTDRSAAGEDRQLDRTGQLVAAAGIIAVVDGVIHGGAAGWTSAQTLAPVAIGVLLLTAFIAVERRSAHPVVEPRLFRSAGFTAAGVAAMAVLFSVIGTVFVLSLYFAHLDVSGLGIAVRLSSLFAGNATASVIASRLQRRLGARTVLVTGLAIATLGELALLTIGDHTALAAVTSRLVLTGVGCGLVMATATAVAVQSAPGQLAGAAGAANNAVRQLGGALGAAVIGGIFAGQLDAGSSYTSAVHASVAVLAGVLATAALLSAALLFHARSSTPTHA